MKTFKDTVSDFEFQMNGGWPAFFVAVIADVIKYIALGYLVHVGWRMAS